MRKILKTNIFKELVVLLVYFLLMYFQSKNIPFFKLINYFSPFVVIAFVVLITIKIGIFKENIFLSICLLYCKLFNIITVFFLINQFPGYIIFLYANMFFSLLFIAINFFHKKTLANMNILMFIYLQMTSIISIILSHKF